MGIDRPLNSFIRQVALQGRLILQRPVDPVVVCVDGDRDHCIELLYVEKALLLHLFFERVGLVTILIPFEAGKIFRHELDGPEPALHLCLRLSVILHRIVKVCNPFNAHPGLVIKIYFTEYSLGVVRSIIFSVVEHDGLWNRIDLY